MDKSADEEPKTKIAKRVMTPTRKYFVPSHGVEVVADSVDKAIELADATDEKKAEDSER